MPNPNHIHESDGQAGAAEWEEVMQDLPTAPIEETPISSESITPTESLDGAFSSETPIELDDTKADTNQSIELSQIVEKNRSEHANDPNYPHMFWVNDQELSVTVDGQTEQLTPAQAAKKYGDNDLFMAEYNLLTHHDALAETPTPEVPETLEVPTEMPDPESTPSLMEMDSPEQEEIARKVGAKVRKITGIATNITPELTDKSTHETRDSVDE